MKKFGLALTYALFSLTSLCAFEDGEFFHVSSRFQGEEKVMKAVTVGEIVKVELATKRDKRNSWRQLWKISPAKNGYFRLTMKLHGDEYSLDVIGDDPESNQIQLTKTGDSTGQLWKITEEKDGYFRLTTKWGGQDLSLDVCNEGDDSKMLGLIRSNDALGQAWKFTKVSKENQE